SAGYAADLIDHATATALLDRLTRLLTAVAADPDLPVSAVALLAPGEHDDLVRPAPRRPVPHTRVDERIAERARTAPDAVALVDTDGAALTYGELLDRADRLARVLGGAGAGPGTIIAVALPRSAELVTALFAVLRAGAAYLPLDPEHPDARLADMIADARPVCVLTSDADKHRFPDVPILVAGADNAPISVPDTSDPRSPEVRDEHPAYVLYTSGSTGRPKGVVVSHKALANQLSWVQDAYPLTHGDRFLHKAPAGFDIAIWETFWPLCAGATVVIAEPGGQRDAGYLAALVREHGVTAAHFVPPMLDAFLAAWPNDPAGSGQLPAPRLLLCGGEALPPATADRAERVLGIRPHNTYGPTEAAITATAWTSTGPHADTMPIGHPVWNTGALVLDRRLAPVPVGVPGELYLTGDQLADGYLGRPGLTAERFTAAPYGPPGARMYRTGDLVRRRADGALEFLGRTDDQVKIRGVRIEPGEIEACLTARPDIAAAVVAVWHADSGAPRLVAYAVPDQDAHTPDVDELRAHLAELLPAHMVPSAVVPLDTLPLLPSGKTDRAALPEPAVDTESRYQAPRTPEEAALAEVFAAVLGRARVGVEDGFFALGGDSIGATLLASRARAAGLAFTVRDVFRHPTVAALARTATTRRPTEESAASPADTLPGVNLTAEQRRSLDRALGGPGDASGIADVLPLSALQEGLLFHLLLDDDTRGIYTQQVVLDLTGPVDPERMAAAVRVVLEKYPNLRAGFVPLGDDTVQVVPERWDIPYRFAHVTDDVGADDAGTDDAGTDDAGFEEFAAAERDRPWDPQRPPLIRFGLARTGPDAHRLVMTSQVLLIDGWSSGLVLTSLLAAYTDADAERTRPATPFRTYLEWLDGRDPLDARAVWAAYLEGVTEPTRLAPAGFDADAATADSAAEFVRELPADLAARLAARARETGVTLGTLYECAWGVLLAGLTGRDDCVFGALVSGRHPAVPGVETTVGLLFNTVPVRVRVRAGESPRTLWRRVHDEKSELFEHPEVSLAELQALTGAGPLFDTFFVVQNLPLPDKATRYGPDRAVGVLGHEVRDA
ncbi:MAG: amino acid adenylation domain-containing protein, partial [Streptomycetaceae bacterium]|nr:amino acid adenylation domain-containing protein [Streptomycetaceae bacterium]